MGSFNEAKEAEFLLEDIEGSIVLGDRGYWVMKLIEKMKEKRFNLYVGPRGKGGKRFLEGEMRR
ncbi:MAG TPA: transposase, partial [Thermotogaceae bacterium]|nr:transposase [Thermotogaceae bacterium]